MPDYSGINPGTGFIEYACPSGMNVSSRSFSFLNESRRFGNQIDWSVPEKGRLWRYNLHYFQYLLTDSRVDPAFGTGLIRDWIDKNPAGTPDAWDPFPVSLRLVSWIKFLARNLVENPDRDIIAGSMVIQARWLMKHLEYHLLGNHLFKNGKTLVFMGTCFKGSEAGQWLDKGLEIISAELDEQVLEDGGHFERSPMYHSMILEDCLDLINIIEDDALKTRLQEKAGRMVSFLKSMCHPDGRISLFNDAAFGIEPEPDLLFDYYTRLTGKEVELPEKGIKALPESGYYVLSPDDPNKMIIDCGQVGPDYQPGHSHCDTLSFELSVKGQRVIVDSGCCQYVDGEIRQYNRGNKGHNTIAIDGENQSEVWGAHRCARKARPLDAACMVREDGALGFEGGHDGYTRLKGKPVHFREVIFKDNTWRILDKIEGRGRHRIESRLHFHPSMELVYSKDEVIVSSSRENMLKVRWMAHQEIQVEKGWYCPEFGKKTACDVLVYRADQAALPFECGWELEQC